MRKLCNINIIKLGHSLLVCVLLVACEAGGDGVLTSKDAHSVGSLSLPPGGVSASAGDKAVTLHWRTADTADYYTVYKVYDATCFSPDCVNPDATTDSLTHTVGNLDNGITYAFYVTAVNASGESGYSKRVLATPQATQGTADIAFGAFVDSHAQSRIIVEKSNEGKTIGKVSVATGNPRVVSLIVPTGVELTDKDIFTLSWDKVAREATLAYSLLI